jgi:hypothetical protein
MAIQIVGATSGRERDAAEDLRTVLQTRFRNEDAITIVAGAKCFGEQRQDIDLLVIAALAKGFIVLPEELPTDFKDERIYVGNFVLVVEVKDHGRERVRFEGNQVHVAYREGWSDATQQSEEQKYSVRSFLNRCAGKSPFLFNAVWLRNVHGSEFPASIHNLLPSNVTAAGFVRLLVTLSHNGLGKQRANGENYLSISSSRIDDARALHDVAEIFRRQLPVTPMDRRRVERISAKILKEQQYAEKFGSQLLLFRGRGGSGKTVRLLQLAKTLHDERGWRILFLTYNRALVADVRRTLAILGIGDKVDDRTIAIRTCDSYFFSLTKVLGYKITQEGDRFPKEEYSKAKDSALELIRLATPEEFRRDTTFRNNPDVFGWDLVLVDEGQDWPPIDRDLLFAAFGSEKIVIADGVDQFVTGNRSCDWTSAAPNRQIVPLRKALRLRANLCRFVKSFADETGLPWDLEVNDEVPGGRVLLIKGPYTQPIHERLMQQHLEAKNLPIDSLCCVTGALGSSSHKIVNDLRGWGKLVWDGTVSSARESFPTELEEHRVVNYHSCRGLEGWTVMCFDADKFFEQKMSEAVGIEKDLLTSADDHALRHAARWSLIAFTRAIDTLVLQVADGSRLAQILDRIAKEHSSIVSIIPTPGPRV